MSTDGIAEQEYSKEVLGWIPGIFKKVIVEKDDTFVVGEYQGIPSAPYDVKIPEEKKNFYGPLLSNPPEEMKELVKDPYRYISSKYDKKISSKPIKVKSNIPSVDKAIAIIAVECKFYNMEPFVRRIASDITGKNDFGSANDCAKEIKNYLFFKYYNNLSANLFSRTLEDLGRFTITYGVVNKLIDNEEAEKIINSIKEHKSGGTPHDEMKIIIQSVAKDDKRKKELLFGLSGAKSFYRGAKDLSAEAF